MFSMTTGLTQMFSKQPPKTRVHSVMRMHTAMHSDKDAR